MTFSIGKAETLCTFMLGHAFQMSSSCFTEKQLNSPARSKLKHNTCPTATSCGEYQIFSQINLHQT